MFWENLDVSVYAIKNYQTCQTDTNDYTMFLIKLDSVFHKQLQVDDDNGCLRNMNESFSQSPSKCFARRLSQK